MAVSYAQGVAPTGEALSRVDQKIPGDNEGTKITSCSDLVSLAKSVFSINVSSSHWSIDQIKAEITQGSPVICAVTASYLQNRPYPWTGGHFILVVGFTDTDIICNDPATHHPDKGHNHYYPINEFIKASNAQNNGVVVGFCKTSASRTSNDPDWLKRIKKEDVAIYSSFIRNGGLPNVGAPVDNGGGSWIHSWGPNDSLWVLDMKGGNFNDSMFIKVKHSDQAFCVHSGIRWSYLTWKDSKKNTGPSSVLGPPTSDEERVTRTPKGNSGSVQHFKGGDIYWDEKLKAAIVVTK